MTSRAWIAAAAAIFLSLPAGARAVAPNYVVQPEAFGWVDIATPANDFGLSGDDSGASSRPIGFTFTFFGTPHVNIGVSTNGYLSFGGVLTPYENQPLLTAPSASSPTDLLAVFWDDLIVRSGGHIYAATIGTAPDRRFVVSWEDVDFYQGNDPMSFQAILEEASQDVVYQYRSMVATTRGHGDSATIGIENAAASEAVQFSYDQANVQDGLAIRFRPVDTDGDGLPDSFERTYGTDPGDPNSPDLTEDVDGDGLNWLQEYRAGTSPRVADTDGDGLSDGQELALGTNPNLADSDGDGAPDGAELAAGTDPLHNDIPTATITRFGPSETFGQTYFQYQVANAPGASFSGVRVYYGAAHGTVATSYVAYFDIPDADARSGFIDQRWLPGVPEVYFRIAPIYAQGGLTFVGSHLSGEGSAYFAGWKPGTFPEQSGTPGTTSTSSHGCNSAGGEPTLTALLLGALALIGRIRRRRA